MGCHEISSIHEAQKRIEAGDPAPECPCGGYLKPDTISFGQNLDPATITRAENLAGQCGAMLVVGSTLQVHPAASLPVTASRAGAFLGIINLSQTPCDSIADALIRQKAGKALPSVLEAISKT
jgi:NAD-dependent deacetylase